MKRILICAAGGSPATNFVRSLRMAPEQFFLLGIDANKYTLQRSETDESFLVPRADDPNYLNVLNALIEKFDIEFVHAQNDIEMEFLSENREKLNAKLFLPAKETVRICVDKFKSYNAWNKAGIPLPGTMLLNDANDLKTAFEEFGPKIWLRNIKGAAGKGSYPTSDYEEALSWVNFRKGWGHFTAAEFLSDNSTTWMSIWNQGELVVAQSRKRLYWELSNRAPSGVTGVTGAALTFANPEFDDLAIRTIKAVDEKPHGIFSVDMTYDQRGMPNPTEINIGRFFTTHFFFTEAGLNMPYILVKLAYNEPIDYKFDKKINPLPNNLAWIRGVDFEPILTNVDNIDNSEKLLAELLNQF